VEQPNTLEYRVHKIIPGVMTKIDFNVGFKVQPRMNLYFRQVIDNMVSKGEFEMTCTYDSMKKYNIPPDFRFVLIDRIQNYDYDFQTFEQFIMNIYNVIKRLGIRDVRFLGLDSSNLIEEKVPLESEDMIRQAKKLYRIDRVE
jgi:KUP system potassium uptake protein